MRQLEKNAGLFSLVSSFFRRGSHFKYNFFGRGWFSALPSQEWTWKGSVENRPPQSTWNKNHAKKGKLKILQNIYDREKLYRELIGYYSQGIGW